MQAVWIDRIRILRQSLDEWALIMNARLMRGPSRQEDKQIWKSSEGLTYLRYHYFKQPKEDLLIITKKNSDPNHNYIDEKSAWWASL